ncbi:MAG: AsmA-like C-terminal region-containing protein [Candidatus Sulfotelmatobacter sp.]
MASVTVPSSANLSHGGGRRPWLVRRALVLAVAILAVGCAAIFCVGGVWAFRQARVLEELREVSDSQVRAAAFHRTYFPHPGCVLENVSFVHGANAGKPLITIERLTIQSTYFGILRRHINLMNAAGLRVMIPPSGTLQPFHSEPSTLTVDELVANGASIEFESGDRENPPLRFDVHEASLSNLAAGEPFHYRVKVRNPEPPGEVTASGKFGAWQSNDPTRTPISGEYKFEKADLSVYGGIAGTLSSAGKFGGEIQHIDISGTTDVPDFEVNNNGHHTHLTTEFSAYVDGTNGDTFLNRVEAHFRKTQVNGAGSIAKSADANGKIARLELSSRIGRIEDILGLFVEDERPPMSGAVTLRATVEIPAGEFLRKVRLRGTFGIAGGEFSQTSTQQEVNKLSAGASGEKDASDPETALTDLSGRVRLDQGLAHLWDLSFSVPGAAARMHGTFDVLNYKIDLHGQMHVETKASNTSTGAKALLLKMLDPFFKKRKRGEILPVQITGTYKNPSFGLDPMDKRAQVAPPPKAHGPVR